MQKIIKKAKDVCSKDGCNKISQHYSMDNGCKTGHCIAHIDNFERDTFKAKRYEHKILNSVARDLDNKVVRKAQFDQTLSREIKNRPDLLLHSNNGTDIVVIEIDENFHRKKAHEDVEREAILREFLSLDEEGKKTKKVHIIRIVPMETKQKIGMVRKNSDGYVLESNEYTDILKLVNHKIHKRLIGRASTDDTVKITPVDYKKLKTQSMILFGQSEKESLKNIKIFTDILADPESWKSTYPKELSIRRTSDSPIKQVSSPISLNETPISYITRQMSPKTKYEKMLNSRDSLLRAISPPKVKRFTLTDRIKNLNLK